VAFKNFGIGGGPLGLPEGFLETAELQPAQLSPGHRLDFFFPKHWKAPFSLNSFS
jgi:hypothetical protein